MREPPIPLTRRSFMKEAGCAAGAAATLLARRQVPASPPANATVPAALLGRTGTRVSRLGLGCAPFRLKEVTTGDASDILHRALELGVRYFDVAPNYGGDEGGFAETKMGPAIKELRDRVFLVTKTEAPTYEGTWRLLRQSMKRLQTDRFDLVHVHNFGEESRFPDLELLLGDKGALGALREAKKSGVVRFLGASGHLYPSRFHALLDTGEIDVLMNPINYVVQHTYDFEHKVWSRARRDNLGLVAMKVLGGRTGSGFRLPAASYEKAIRYALSVPGLSCALVGVRSLAELERAAQVAASFQPLSDEERHELAREGLELARTAEWKAAYGEPTA